MTHLAIKENVARYGRCGKALDHMQQTGEISRTKDLEARFSKAQTRRREISTSLEWGEYNTQRELSPETVRQASRYSTRHVSPFWHY